MSKTPEEAVERIKQLANLLGRPPKQSEYVAHYHAGVNSLQQFGGYSAVRDLAMKEIEFLASQVPEEDIPIGEIIEYRKKQFKQKQKHEEAVANRKVEVLVDGPFAIAHFGDPHVDDDGCDIGLLEKHKSIVMNTKGMLAANVGDVTNNWVGRLAQLYGDQSTKRREAIKLAEWFLSGIKWLYLVSGNHDAWSGEDDPIQWMVNQGGSLWTRKTSIRLFLNAPNGRQIIVNARHDFPGHSMWNHAHGPMRAATMGWRDHILTCGHRHISGYGILKDPASGRISHAIRVASYKTYDKYAEQKGFPDHTISPCVVTMINPDAEEESGLITVFHDVRAAADYLDWARARWSKGKKVR